MKALLRLGFIASVVGMGAVTGVLADEMGGPGTGTRVAYAAEPVDIDLYAGGGFEVISLGTSCSTNLHPGLVCTDAMQIRNVGELSFEYDIEAWSDINNTDDGAPGFADDDVMECINVNVVPGSSDGLNVGDASTWGPQYAGFLEAGDTDGWDLEVSVDDDNACQGQQGFIFAYVIATAEMEPQTETDPPSASSTPVPDGSGGGGGGNGGSPSAGGSPGGGSQPPAAHLDATPSQFVPPVTGGAGLIGDRPAADTPLGLIVALLGLAGVALGCIVGLRQPGIREER